MIKTSELFTLSHTIGAALFAECTYPWEALEGISDFIVALGQSLDPQAFDSPAENVWIAKSATVAPSAWIGGPCIIEIGRAHV